MNEIELSNKNGIPVSTVGELKKLLLPFMDECPINNISVFYIGSGTDGAKLSIRPCNTQMQINGLKCNCINGIPQTTGGCPVHGVKY